MADTDVIASLQLGSGEYIPMENLAMTESSSGLASSAVELQTDATFTTTAQSLGTFAQNQMLVAGVVYTETSGLNAFIDRKGLPLTFLPIARAGVSNSGIKPLLKPVMLQPGDKLMVCNAANATRSISMVAHCKDGTQRCFVHTPSGAGTGSLVDTVTQNSIGDTLQKKVITHVMISSIDGIKLTSGGGVVVIDSQGKVVGSYGATNQTSHCPYWTPVSTPIDLNFDAQVVTSA